MKITYAPKKQTQLTLKDLKPGDVFTFPDKNSYCDAPRLKVGALGEYIYLHPFDSDYSINKDSLDEPVRLLDAELFIYEEE